MDEYFSAQTARESKSTSCYMSYLRFKTRMKIKKAISRGKKEILISVNRKYREYFFKDMSSAGYNVYILNNGQIKASW
jgi:hypothetical protein